eukprot:TRINITY_DN10593_c0_g1_i1.p1 TRINITY_DN10593_c0_g1~~TRINITY_DN10593_c0_g1_i1.p1  ORF type:complete len:377 (+),score=61.84 TRINITY_DN10593_c0_g1_i1:54-1184(+)
MLSFVLQRDMTTKISITQLNTLSSHWFANVSLKKYWGTIDTLVIGVEDGVQVVDSYVQTLPTLENSYSVELLKSCLQKATRRSLPQTCLNVGYQLLCQDPIAFLRRLPVIILEDCLLHPDLPYVVWLMIAVGKGWKLRDCDIYKLLCLLVDLGSVKCRDFPFSPDLEGFENNFVNILLEKNDLIYKEYYASMVLRVNYGGMFGDMVMFMKYAHIWSNRFDNDISEWNQFISDSYTFDQTIYQDIPKDNYTEHFPCLTEEDKLSPAVDFHCFPNMIKNLHTSIKTSDIKSAVWIHQSSITDKEFICSSSDPYVLTYPCDHGTSSDYLDVWNKIKHLWLKESLKLHYWRETPISKKKKKKKKKKEQKNKITNYFTVIE